MCTGQTRQHGLHLTHCQHHGQTLGRLGLRDVVQPRQFNFKHLAVKEQQRTLGLILRGSRNLAGHRKMGKESLDVARAQILGVALAVKVNIAFNPVQVGLFSANAIVLHAQLIAHLVKQLGRFCRGAFIG